jgi:hypothetical protein
LRTSRFVPPWRVILSREATKGSLTIQVSSTASRESDPFASLGMTRHGHDLYTSSMILARLARMRPISWLVALLWMFAVGAASPDRARLVTAEFSRRDRATRCPPRVLPPAMLLALSPRTAPSMVFRLRLPNTSRSSRVRSVSACDHARLPS